MPKSSVLVVDDTTDILLSFKGFLEDEGYTVATASTGQEGISKARQLDVDAVMLDLMLPDIHGLDVLSKIKSFRSDLPVIMISGEGTIDLAVKATKLGAYDFIEKPLDPDKVLLSLQRALQWRELERQNLKLQQQLEERRRVAEERREERDRAQQALLETQAQLVKEMGKELHVAHNVQMGLLPKADPHIPGFNIAGVCIPASHVGGDHYTYIWLDEENTKLAIVIADVSGKEMKGAMTVMRFSEMLRYETQGRRSPGEILTGLNRSICGRLEHRMYVTACVGVLDVSEKALEVSNAGHPPVYHLSGENGTVMELGTYGHPLGVRQDAAYEGTQVKLAEGDRLLFYTDGTYEARNREGDMYGFERLERAMRDSRGDTTAKGMTDRVLGDVERFIGTPEHEDDITLVAVKIM